MLHLSSPSWETQANPVLDILGWWFGGLGVAGLLAGLIVALIIRVNTKNKDKAGLWLLGSFIVFYTFVAVAVIVPTVSSLVRQSDHRSEVANWLQHDYGVSVSADSIDLGHKTVSEAAATVDGRTRIIKLAHTSTGGIAVFTTDDKPLQPLHGHVE